MNNAAIDNILYELESARRRQQAVDIDVKGYSTGYADGIKIALYFLGVVDLDGNLVKPAAPTPKATHAA